MKICVLQSDYSPSDVDFQHHDPYRDLTALFPGHTVDHVKLNKLTTYRQLKELASMHYDIFVNLCEGYYEWAVPSIDVIDAMERLSLPHTGPPATLYHQPKSVMKYVAYTVGVQTPLHALITSSDNLDAAVAGLRYPLFVKPAHAGDSLGIDDASLVHGSGELAAQVRAVIAEFGETLVEEYVDGREFTVLVVASPDEGAQPAALTPVEFVFPEGMKFKNYAAKTSDLHPGANVPVRDDALAERLRDAALRIFNGFGGVGYARMDFRLSEAGELFFLEVNFTCSVFYTDGMEGSADYVLKYDPMGTEGFAARIVEEGIARHRRSRRPFVMRGNAVSGYGIFATEPIAAGRRVFPGEARPHRIVTARHVRTWSAHDQLTFRRYAYPLSEEVFAIWSKNPADWAPQNHSCDANTGFDGLDLVAARAIAIGEELTLDYATCMDANSEPFTCACGSAHCRGLIVGTPGSSLSSRERAWSR